SPGSPPNGKPGWARPTDPPTSSPGRERPTDDPSAQDALDRLMNPRSRAAGGSGGRRRNQWRITGRTAPRPPPAWACPTIRSQPAGRRTKTRATMEALDANAELIAEPRPGKPELAPRSRSARPPAIPEVNPRLKSAPPVEPVV